MAFFAFPIAQIQSFFFVFVRVTAILFTVPFFDTRSIPVLVKAGLALALSLLMAPQLNLGAMDWQPQPVGFALAIGAEISIGLIIGLAARLIFAGLQLAGQMAGFQMGFAIANVVDPASSLQIPLLSQFFNLFALLIFLSINAHYYFIRALAESFILIPPWGAHISAGLFKPLMAMTANAFVIAVKVGAPVMVALLLTSVALGLMARTVPQMQIFIVAMPLKILIGLIFMGLALPFLTIYLQHLFGDLGRHVSILLHLMR